MHPLLPFRGSLRSSPTPPTPSIHTSFGSSFSFASSSPSILHPLPPTSAPAASVSSATTSSTTSPSTKSYGQSSSSSSCAYPSWPNRPSLVSTDSTTSVATTASAYISDEELLDTTTTPLTSPSLDSESSCAVVDDNDATVRDPTINGVVDMSVATERRIREMREVAEEEEQRARFLAAVQAHARAQQLAMRVQHNTSITTHNDSNNSNGIPAQNAPVQGMGMIAARRTKQRKTVVPVVGKKRRTTSSSSRGYPRV